MATCPGDVSPAAGSVDRRLLTKRGGWLRRPVRRWCHLERGELVYYTSRDAQVPKGRIPLRDCMLGEAGKLAVPMESGTFDPPYLELVREGKGPCQIYPSSADEFVGLAAYIEDRCQASSAGSSSGPCESSTRTGRLGLIPGSAGATTVASRQQSRGSEGASQKTVMGNVPDATLLAVCPGQPSPRADKRFAVEFNWPSGRSAQQGDRGSSTPKLRDDDHRVLEATSPHHVNFIFGRVLRGVNDAFNGDDGATDVEEIRTTPSMSRPSMRSHEDLGVGPEEWDLPSVATEAPIPLRREDNPYISQPTTALGIARTHLGEIGLSVGAGGISAARTPLGPDGHTVPHAPTVPRDLRPAERPPQLSAKDAYREAMCLMWNYNLEGAQQLLEPWRSSSVWHAGAYAECRALGVVVTGRHKDALATLELVCQAEAMHEAVKGSTGTVVSDVFSAEMLLMRGGLQVILGSRLRALFNLRQCWYTYRRLEQHLNLSDTSEANNAFGDHEIFTSADLRGRIYFGLGLFYYVTSMMPMGLCPLLRLAGFVIDRPRGKQYLAECVHGDLGPRQFLAAIILAMHHLDLERDLSRAADLLVTCIERQPECVLLHWAGSLLAWRNTCITEAIGLTEQALWCCGEEMSHKAIYLRYELGMFHFMSMSWTTAYHHLRYVYDTVHGDRIFIPHKTLVATQLAAVAFCLGRDAEGETLCRECASWQDWSGGALRLEGDFAKIMQVFLKRRVVNRRLLVFEVMYLLRQFPRVPAPLLLALQAQIQQVVSPYAAQCTMLRGFPGGMPGCAPSSSSAVASPGPSTAPQLRANSPEMGILVEYVSAQVIQVIILFYLGDLEQAMTFVPQLSRLLNWLPAWCGYLTVHGLYWCGRILALSDQLGDARRCLQQAKAHKKYPFNISTKVAKVLEGLEAKTNA